MPYHIKTISEFHVFRNLPTPDHPLVSVVNFEDIRRNTEDEPKSLVMDFYSIALKRNFHAKLKYGQQEYDFKEGVMAFMGPGQVFSIEADKDFQHTGWMVLVHPDFLWNTPLAKKIRQYEYFSYSVNEALHLSGKEETAIITLINNIAQEYHANIDQFGQDVIIAQLELLLTYAGRYYHRQFITRKISNHKILNRLESLLADYFRNDELVKKGLPTVLYVAESLNISPGYLSSMLKVLTGQSTQQHIQHKLIELAKEKLTTTDLSVSEIAYELGFEHSQSFSKLFKSKMKITPLEYRESFN